MQRRRLPPLNPLRCFEATARHGSFTKAAQELHVTTVAVSRQVAVLEKYFGMALFVRLHQGVALTADGSLLFLKVEEAFNLINEASRMLRPASPHPLMVYTYNTLAANWLIPRLSSFSEQHPDIELEISTGANAGACDYRKVDVGIHYINETPDGFMALTLFPDIIQLVCSPSMLRGGHGLPPLENLVHHTVLHSEYRHHDWTVWLRAAGAESLKPKAEIMFRGPGLTYQAAAQGLGVAMAQPVMVMSELLSGRLVIPLPVSGSRNRRMCAVYRRNLQADHRIRAFCGWLQAEADRSTGEIAQLLRNTAPSA